MKQNHQVSVAVVAPDLDERFRLEEELSHHCTHYSVAGIDIYLGFFFMVRRNKITKNYYNPKQVFYL